MNNGEQPFLNLNVFPTARSLWIRKTLSFRKVGQRHGKEAVHLARTLLLLSDHQVTLAHRQIRVIQQPDSLSPRRPVPEFTSLQNWGTNL